MSVQRKGSRIDRLATPARHSMWQNKTVSGHDSDAVERETRWCKPYTSRPSVLGSQDMRAEEAQLQKLHEDATIKKIRVKSRARRGKKKNRMKSQSNSKHVGSEKADNGNGPTPPQTAWARQGRHSRFSVQGGVHHPASIPGAGHHAHKQRSDRALQAAKMRHDTTRAGTPSSDGDGDSSDDNVGASLSPAENRAKAALVRERERILASQRERSNARKFRELQQQRETSQLQSQSQSQSPSQPTAGPRTAWARQGRHSRFSVQGGVHHPASIPGVGHYAHKQRSDRALDAARARNHNGVLDTEDVRKYDVPEQQNNGSSSDNTSSGDDDIPVYSMQEAQARARVRARQWKEIGNTTASDSVHAVAQSDLSHSVAFGSSVREQANVMDDSGNSTLQRPAVRSKDFKFLRLQHPSSVRASLEKMEQYIEALTTENRKLDASVKSANNTIADQQAQISDSLERAESAERAFMLHLERLKRLQLLLQTEFGDRAAAAGDRPNQQHGIPLSAPSPLSSRSAETLMQTDAVVAAAACELETELAEAMPERIASASGGDGGSGGDNALSDVQSRATAQMTVGDNICSNITSLFRRQAARGADDKVAVAEMRERFRMREQHEQDLLGQAHAAEEGEAMARKEADAERARAAALQRDMAASSERLGQSQQDKAQLEAALLQALDHLQDYTEAVRAHVQRRSGYVPLSLSQYLDAAPRDMTAARLATSLVRNHVKAQEA